MIEPNLVTCSLDPNYVEEPVQEPAYDGSVWSNASF